MAGPQGQMKVGRYLLAFVLILAAAYAAVFLGGGSNTPKLGLDLQGGTTVTLEAATADGKAPAATELETARQIIENRVNGLGVASAEVVTAGDRNIVISVPGQEGEQAKQLGATAKLEMRPVVQSIAPAGAATASATASGSAAAATTPTASPSAQVGESSSAAPPANGAPAAPLAETTDSSAPAAPTSAAPATPTASADATASAVPVGSDTQEGAAAIAATLDCSAQTVSDAELAPTPTQFMASCDDAGNRYVLGPVIIKGTEIDKAAAGFDTQGGQGWVISLTFNSAGTSTWAQYTSANVGNNVAFVLDQRVLTAPTIQGAITGTTQITGQFTQKSAEDLANSLNFGALPLNFTQQEARTVSATLGLESLRAGLIAGGIGLALVALYCLVYYRFLGLVTILSLVLSGAVVYAALILLGRSIGFTLSLAGIAGFIVAIGITADSFVIYFERLKDEIREGRPVRSAVPRAWVRARRTILSADAVSFLAAMILFLLTVGDVKGFAFTLGLSTILDLVVVFLFTHPLVSYLSRFRSFASPTFSGLGRNVRQTRVAGTKPTPGDARERARARRAAVLKES